MFHIGVATKHPPLPDPSQLSLQGIDFIQKCLIIDGIARPTAEDLQHHVWILDIKSLLAEDMDPETGSSASSQFDAAIPLQAALMEMTEVETLREDANGSINSDYNSHIPSLDSQLYSDPQ
jgi:mitogen-activated protein kinase kinase kinase